MLPLVWYIRLMLLSHQVPMILLIPHIRDKTYTLEFNLILAITDTSKYNAGNNLVNLFYLA